VELQYQEFLKAAYHVGEEAFRSAFETVETDIKPELWTACTDRYGRGDRFTNYVVEMFQSRFAELDPARLQIILKERIGREWQSKLIGRLRQHYESLCTLNGQSDEDVPTTCA
jgi:hypothetical protein